MFATANAGMGCPMGKLKMKADRMNIDITPAAQSAIKALVEELQMDKKNLTSRLLIWLHQQDQVKRLEILGILARRSVR